MSSRKQPSPGTSSEPQSKKTKKTQEPTADPETAEPDSIASTSTDGPIPSGMYRIVNRGGKEVWETGDPETDKWLAQFPDTPNSATDLPDYVYKTSKGFFMAHTVAEGLETGDERRARLTAAGLPVRIKNEEPDSDEGSSTNPLEEPVPKKVEYLDLETMLPINVETGEPEQISQNADSATGPIEKPRCTNTEYLDLETTAPVNEEIDESEQNAAVLEEEEPRIVEATEKIVKNMRKKTDNLPEKIMRQEGEHVFGFRRYPPRLSMYPFMRRESYEREQVAGASSTEST